jgi:predicted small lipoprotein YifL
MRKLLTAVMLAAIVFAAAGCGESGEKGKNKDKDVPKPAKGEPSA